MKDNQLYQTLRKLPKIDLHRHLEGSVRLETLVDIAEKSGVEMPEYDAEMLRPFVQMMPGETRNMQHFLGKFHTLRQFYRSPEVICRVAREAVEDAAADNIQYLELRFTPAALSNIINCSYDEVVSWVCDAVDEAARTNQIQARLILSMNRNESVEKGEQVLAAALSHQDKGVVAIDLAGNEANFPSSPFLDIFHRARSAGLGVTIHAGEWGDSANIREAVDNLGAVRIGHGVRAIEDEDIVKMLVDRGIVLEICPTSNYQSGVVDTWAAHPLPELWRRGVSTTINTDDPLLSGITLTDELVSAVSNLSLTVDDMKQHVLTAARAAFLPDSERAALVSQFTTLLDMNHSSMNDTPGIQ
ncbi:MAG: adenosine deaminase [Anaerolineaceae bacterium]|nr:adenosine deaminase [Anaerolineaceae bacterium]